MAAPRQTPVVPLPSDGGGAGDLRAFLDAYRQALVAGDAAAVAAFYRTPLPVIRPDRLRVIESRAILRDELRKILDVYRWAGMRAVDLRDLRTDGFEPGLCVATFIWSPLRADGVEIARIHQSFVLRRTRVGRRIAAVIAHDEEARRAPIVAEAARGLVPQTGPTLRLAPTE